MPICKKCSLRFPRSLKIDGKYRNLGNRSYCLSCSPFGKHNTAKIERQRQTVATLEQIPEMMSCGICNNMLPKTNFGTYRCRGGWKIFPYCKVCDSIRVKTKQRRLKQRCVDYKGGKCQLCGYKKCLRSLEFHRDPSKKDFSISQWNLSSQEDFEKLKSELDKCDLFCSNCHGEVHDQLDNAGMVSIDEHGTLPRSREECKSLYPHQQEQRAYCPIASMAP